jgi:uncharacterized protein YcfJ
VFKALSIALVALTMIGVAAPMPAAAQYRHAGYYDGQGYGYQPVAYRKKRYGRNYYRGYRRCYDKGNGGLAIGGIAGGLLGNTIAKGDDKLVGTIIGAGVGALAGRAIDRSDGRRC